MKHLLSHLDSAQPVSLRYFANVDVIRHSLRPESSTEQAQCLFHNVTRSPGVEH